MIPPSLPPFGRWWTTFSRLFPSLRLLLPIRRRDPSICLPLHGVADDRWRFPRVRFCLGPMLFLILSRRRSSDSPVVLRMYTEGLSHPFVYSQQVRKGIEFELYLPTQGKEHRKRANPDVLDLLRNRVPDSRHVPLSLKEAAALEQDFDTSCI